MSDWQTIQQHISKVLAKPVQLSRQSSVAGGSINRAMRVEASVDGREQAFFIKLNHANRLDMFEAEAEGLLELENAHAIRVPHVLCTGVAGEQSYIVLEYLNMGAAKASSIQALAEQMVKLHQHTAQQFGWKRQNTIGATPQHNNRNSNWIDFLREHRFAYQLRLAEQNGGGRAMQKKGQALLDNLESYFTGYDPEPSLLHGDLWSGNYGFDDQGAPVIFDPATYYGDREADIAMTELFGGFPREFYTAYNQAWPLDEGYQTRKTLYNLYHILNHFNLFGGGYGMQAEQMLNQLV